MSDQTRATPTAEGLLREAGAHVGGFPMHTAVEKHLAQRLADALAEKYVSDQAFRLLKSLSDKEIESKRQRAEAAEAERDHWRANHDAQVRKKQHVSGLLAEAQQREAWWREWYELGEVAARTRATPEIIARAKELRRMLGLEDAQ